MLKYVLGGLTIILLLTSGAFAQQMQDVVYLKDGSVVRGTIIEQVPGVSVKIQTRDGNIFVYKIENIERIIKEPVERVHLRGKKSPLLALGLSVLFPGIGQCYNGEYIKGAIQGGICLMCAPIIIAVCLPDGARVDPALGYSALLIACGVGWWSWIDAPISASRINRERGFGHLIEFNKDKYVLGLDAGLTPKGLGAKVTLHF